MSKKLNKLISLPLIFALLFIGCMSLWQTTAQDAITPEDTQEPPLPAIIVYGLEPGQITSGQPNTLSIFGANFSAQTSVRVQGIGIVPVTLINSGALTAEIPATIPAGQYIIYVGNTVETAVAVPNPLIVLAAPLLTQAPPEPLPTFSPSTPIPGRPNLLVRSFTTTPATTSPGGTVTMTFEVVNQGNRPAQGVSVSVDAASHFVPANGQASALLPDIGAGLVTSVTLTVITPSDAESGSLSIPLTLAYRDFSGEAYTSTAALSVTVQAQPEASQITLARYMLDPNPVTPGESVNLTVLLINSGNEAASQALLRIGGEGSVLLPGAQGDSFPLGNIAPGASVGLELPLIVSTEADNGPQAQPFTIEYLQSGETKTISSSLTVQVAMVTQPQPLILLSTYDAGEETLKPGDRFTLSLTLQNVGESDAAEMLVTFGTVESTGGSSGGAEGTPSGGSTSTTPSTTFAPLGTGGTVFVGDVTGNGGEITIEQEFIVNGTVESGIYALPITVRYQTMEGTARQDNLRASVLVVNPPQLQVVLQSPVPEQVNLGEPLSIALNFANDGRKVVNLTGITATTDNGEVVEGAEMFLTPLRADDDISYSALVIPANEGALTVTVTLRYRDDLNIEREIVKTYETIVVAPPPPPEEPVIEITPPPAEQPEDNNRLGRFLLGLLGLGS